MSAFSRFARNEQGNAWRSIALGAAAIAFASMTMAQLLDRASRDGILPHVAINVTLPQDDQRILNAQNSAERTHDLLSGQYDYMPVGSVGNSSAPRIVLDPCTGKSR